MSGRAVGAGVAAASDMGTVPATWSLCSIHVGALRNTDVPGWAGTLASRSLIRIGSYVLSLCSIRERVNR